jgi:Tfp pilus assembly protein FimT
LVELVVVLAVLGVIAAVVAPNLAAALDRLSSPDPPHQLAAVLQAARSEAARTATIVCLEPILTGGRGTLRLAVTRDLSGTAQIPGVVVPTRVDAGAAGSRICFYPTGLASPAGWSLIVQSDTFAIRVDPWNGAVSILR